MAKDSPRLIPIQPSHSDMGPGLIWGTDVSPAGALAVADCAIAPEGGFRWLHLNLAHQRTRSWIEQFTLLPPAARELLLSADTHQRALVDGFCAKNWIFRNRSGPTRTSTSCRSSRP